MCPLFPQSGITGLLFVISKKYKYSLFIHFVFFHKVVFPGKVRGFKACREELVLAENFSMQEGAPALIAYQISDLVVSS